MLGGRAGGTHGLSSRSAGVRSFSLSAPPAVSVSQNRAKKLFSCWPATSSTDSTSTRPAVAPALPSPAQRQLARISSRDRRRRRRRGREKGEGQCWVVVGEEGKERRLRAVDGLGGWWRRRNLRGRGGGRAGRAVYHLQFGVSAPTAHGVLGGSVPLETWVSDGDCCSFIN